MAKTETVCWELYGCRDRSCPVYGDHIIGNPERMKVPAENVDLWRANAAVPVLALSCDYFRDLRRRGRGRRVLDRNLDLFLERALRRLSSLQRRVNLVGGEGQVPPEELNLLGQFSQLIPSLRNVNEVCFALLTVITAKQGLGFNRAILFWQEEEDERIYGHCGIGPLDDEEAGRIWSRLEEEEPWLDLRELVQRGIRGGLPVDSPLVGRVREISLDAKQATSVFARSLREQQEIHGGDLTDPVDRRIVDYLELEHFLTLPLRREDHSLGFLIVDNRFTGSNIDPGSSDTLAVITGFAASILENLILRERLEKTLRRSEATMEVLKEIRGRVIQAEKLATSGELSASVVHEIRNPLMAIGGFSRRLLKSKTLTEEDRGSIEIIAREALRLEETLGRLLHQAQREQLQVRRADLNSEISDIEHLLAERVRQAGISLVTDLGDEVPSIDLDVNRFRQVIFNLIQNAIEAIDGKGTIRVTTELEDDWILVRIEDDGRGMDAEQCRRIFRAFYTTKSGGSGLGLAISQHIIRKHGGELSVESDLNWGTRFSIRLPLAHTRVGASRGEGSE